MKRKLIFLAMVVCLLVFVTVLVFAQNSPNVRWEYYSIRTGNLPNGGKPSVANELGEQGWELVTGATGDSHYLVFKRRLP